MLKGLLQKIFGKRHAAESAVQPRPAVTSEHLEKLILDAARTQDVELNCSSTFEFIDEYVERIASGDDAAGAMPLVGQHLDLCPECAEEYKLLLQVVETLSDDGEWT